MRIFLHGERSRDRVRGRDVYFFDSSVYIAVDGISDYNVVAYFSDSPLVTDAPALTASVRSTPCPSIGGIHWVGVDYCVRLPVDGLFYTESEFVWRCHLSNEQRYSFVVNFLGQHIEVREVIAPRDDANNYFAVHFGETELTGAYPNIPVGPLSEVLPRARAMALDYALDLGRRAQAMLASSPQQLESVEPSRSRFELIEEI